MSIGTLVAAAIIAAEDIDAEILEDIAMEASEGPNEVTEWLRMRDTIDDAEILLKGICQEIGAGIIESKISSACRNLQDLVHQHHGLGD